MTKPARLLTIVVILAACLACDQITKTIARQTLSSAQPVELLGGMLQLQYAENPGAFLSLGAELPPAVRTVLLVIVAAAVLAGALVYALRAESLNTGQLIGLALIAGGGMGNLIDRVTRGGLVADFAVLRAGPLHTGIFNVADVALMGGIALFVLSSLRTPKSV